MISSGCPKILAATLLIFVVSTVSFADASLINAICRQPDLQPSYVPCVELLSVALECLQLTSQAFLLYPSNLPVATNEAADTLVIIEENERDPNISATAQIYLRSCSSGYNQTLALLDRASDDMVQRLVPSVRAAALEAGSDAQKCEETFMGQPSHPSPITSHNANIALFGTIVAIFGTLQR